MSSYSHSPCQPIAKQSFRKDSSNRFRRSVAPETALGRLPFVCFAGSGRASEHVGDDAGFIVPHLDVPAIAAAYVDLPRDPPRQKLMGEAACGKECAHYPMAAKGPKIIAILERSLSAEQHP